MSYFGPLASYIYDVVIYRSKGTGGGVIVAAPSGVPANAIEDPGALGTYITDPDLGATGYITES